MGRQKAGVAFRPAVDNHSTPVTPVTPAVPLCTAYSGHCAFFSSSSQVRPQSTFLTITDVRGGCEEKRELVSWRYEPSQPHRITSELNTNFSPSQSFFISQVIIPKVFFFLFFFQTTAQILPIISERKTRKTITYILELFIFREHSTGTCIQQGDLFYSAGLYRNWR